MLASESPAMNRDLDNIKTNCAIATSLQHDVPVSGVYHLFQQSTKNNPFPTSAIPDPTPIGPGGVKAVSTLPIHSTLLKSDLSQIKTFYKVFGPFLLPKNQPLSSKVAQLPEKTTSSALPRMSITTTRACVDKPKQVLRCGQNRATKWIKRFEELVQFQKQHGHCLVPMHDHPNPALSNWVKRQRTQYQFKCNGIHSTLSDKRQKALEDLGFIWDARTASWHERYDELCQFHREHGHASVPKSYKKNLPLANWVKCQRRQYKLSKGKTASLITEERIRLLEELQFDFNPRS